MSIRLLISTSLITLSLFSGILAISAASAFAGVLHKFLSQITPGLT
jgi:hypothetical protein